MRSASNLESLGGSVAPSAPVVVAAPPDRRLPAGFTVAPTHLATHVVTTHVVTTHVVTSSIDRSTRP